MWNRISRISMGILLAALLTACGNSGSYRQSDAAPEFDFVQAGETEINYEVPKVVPNILVNRLGYEPGSDKIAIFKGDDLPEQFTIREVATDEIVYQGEIEPHGYDEVYQEWNSYGDFSDFREPGNYYLQAKGIGQSYSFMIHDRLYYALLQSGVRQFETLRFLEGTGSGGWSFPQSGSERNVLASQGVYRLLVAYELMPVSYGDDTGVSSSGNGIPDILDECMTEADWIMGQVQTTPDQDAISCGRRTAMLARLSYMVRVFDDGASKKYRAAAQEAYGAFLQCEKIPEDIRLLAETEMYRMTGILAYRETVDLQLQAETMESRDYSEPSFFAAVTYLNTKSAVDTELCDKVIRKIISEAEGIANRSKTQNYQVYSEQDASDTGKLMDEVGRICIVNRIIPNHEYRTVIENHLHFLLGRNPKGICYAAGWNGKEISKEDVFNDPLKNAFLVFILGEQVAN